MKTFAVGLAVVGLVTMASADSLRSQIEAMDKKISSAMKKKDMKAFEKYVRAGVTSDFKYSEDGHSMTFDEMLATMKQSFAQMGTVTQATSKILSLKEKGGNATAECKHMMAWTMVTPDKKTHKMSMVGTSTDVYKKVGKDWKMSSMSWKNGEMKMDGKKVDPSKMGG